MDQSSIYAGPPYPEKHTMVIVFTPEEYLALAEVADYPRECSSMRGWAKKVLLALTNPADASLRSSCL